MQVYVVEVSSAVARYEVKRRYSEFEHFYERCQRRSNLRATFPPRTLLQPGWSEDVTSQRILQLNGRPPLT